MGLGALGGIAGLLLSLLTKVAAGSSMRTDRWRWVAVTIVAVGAGLVAGLVAWDDQEIWRLSENWDAAAAGLTAATTGSALAVLGVVFYDTVRARKGRNGGNGGGDGGGGG